MKKLTLFLIAILIIGTYINHGFAQEKIDHETSVKDTVTPTDYGSVKIGRFGVEVGLGILDGHTTYQIGGTVSTPSGAYEVHFPISELEFPLDVYMASLGAGVGFAEKLKLSANVKINITDDAGNMKDSDWLTPSDPSQLDVYSESDADLDALIMDVNARYRIDRGFFVGIGYLRENFDFETRLIRQYSPSGLPGFDYVGDGSVGLTYEITYDIPYLEIVFMEANDTLTVDASFAYSPIVRAEDEDHHLLRSKVNKGDYDQGDALFLSLRGRYEFATNWFLGLQFDYKKIKAEGKSEAFFNGVYDHTIDLKTESKQTYYFLNIGYAF